MSGSEDNNGTDEAKDQDKPQYVNVFYNEQALEQEALALLQREAELTAGEAMNSYRIAIKNLERLYDFNSENQCQGRGLVSTAILQKLEEESKEEESEEGLIVFFNITVKKLGEAAEESMKDDKDGTKKEKVARQIHDQLMTFNRLATAYCKTIETLNNENVSNEKKVAQLNKYETVAKTYTEETKQNFPATTPLGEKILMGLLIGSGLLLGCVLGAAVGLAVGGSTGLIGHLPGVIAGGVVGTVLGAIQGAGFGVQVALGVVAAVFGTAAIAGIIKARQEHPDKKYQEVFLNVEIKEQIRNARKKLKEEERGSSCWKFKK